MEDGPVPDTQEASASAHHGLWTNPLKKTDTIHAPGRFKPREQADNLPQEWWFASTAIPLLAATIGPLANVLSVAALASKWRVTLPNNGRLPEGVDKAGINIADPEWVTVLNAISLAVGVLGNLALLFNFTKRIRYIIALPLTIIAWYIATGILTGLVIAMNVYTPPIRPGQTYSQGFWYAVIAACLYMIGSMILMVNMLGYFLGHYAQHFELDDDQRTLILQTMMFFLWLAGGAAVFARVCSWSYADALYFCDATILTVGFGDFVANNDVGRGLVLPYSIFGIIFLGLMIKSIRQFAIGMSKDNVIRKHEIKSRERAVSRSVTTEKELRDRLGLPPSHDSSARRSSFLARQSTAIHTASRRRSLEQYGHFDVRGRTITFHDTRARGPLSRMGIGRPHDPNVSAVDDSNEQHVPHKRLVGGRSRRRERLLLLKEEKDRFDAMRDIQASTHKFKRYYALSMSVLAYGILWCFGALVFMYTERRIQNLSYFDTLYFCYVSLLTIGYGDFSPQSNAGKPFFVVWSLIAVPTMTFLVSDMGETVALAINRGTFTLADWTVMPKKGVLHDFMIAHPRLKAWLERRHEKIEAAKRLQEGFTIQDPDEVRTMGDDVLGHSNSHGASARLEQLAEEPLTEHDLARKLAVAIKTTANDLRLPHEKKYSYEEWVEFTRLIRFSSESPQQVEEDEREEGMVEWDWIGENSPMLANVSESEWILDRLCESLNRYTRRQDRAAKHHAQHPHPHTRDNDHTPSPIEKSPQEPNTDHPNTLNSKHLVPAYPPHPGPRSPSVKPAREESDAMKTEV